MNRIRGQLARVLVVMAVATGAVASGVASTPAGAAAPERPTVQLTPDHGPPGTTVHVVGCCWTYVRPAPVVIFTDAVGTKTNFGPAEVVGCHGYFQCEFAKDIVIPSDAATGIGHVKMTRGTRATSGRAKFTVM
jgi:hypothetical protein